MRPLIPCALLCAFVLALGAPTPGPVSAQDAKDPKHWTGQTWEYRVFRLDEKDYRDKSDYQAILRSEGRRGAEAVFYERVLTYLGEEGWDLVSVERRSPDTAYLYLKRLKSR